METSDKSNQEFDLFTGFDSMENLKVPDNFSDTVMRRIESNKDQGRKNSTTLFYSAVIVLFAIVNFSIVFSGITNRSISAEDRKAELKTIATELLINPTSQNY